MKTTLLFLDDLIIGSTLEKTIGDVLTRLKESIFKLIPIKCKLFQSEVQYLGHRKKE